MRKSRILVIDDEPGMLRAVERILSPEHLVQCAPSAAAGLTEIENFKPDVVICDIGMPHMDGFELMGLLKQAQPDLDVILMTGMSEPDLHLVRAIREKAFYFIEKPFNRDVMRTLVDRCLELRRLRDVERRHRARIDRELAEARALQQTMLPPPQAVVEGVHINARCVACSELGGDMYDYAAAGEGRAAVMVADVAGHGVSAALLTAVVKSAFAASAADDFQPRSIVRRVARDIAPFGARRFVTLLAARIDRGAGQLEYVNAGHPAGLFWSEATDLQSLAGTGPLVSPAFGDDEWEQRALPLGRGARLLLYSDGVTEAARDGEQFSATRSIEIVKQNQSGDDGLLEDVLAAVRAHADGRPQVDDLTLLMASV